PEGPVGTSGNTPRSIETHVRGKMELCNYAGRSDPSNLVADSKDPILCEPEGAIRTRRDTRRSAVSRRDRELSDLTRSRDSPDFIRSIFGEPERAVGPGGYANRPAARHAEYARGLRRCSS